MYAILVLLAHLNLTGSTLGPDVNRPTISNAASTTQKVTRSEQRARPDSTEPKTSQDKPFVPNTDKGFSGWLSQSKPTDWLTSVGALVFIIVGLNFLKEKGEMIKERGDLKERELTSTVSRG